MTGREIVFARRVLQRKWLPRDVVDRCLHERRSRAGRERDVPLWDLLVERRLLTPAQVRQILEGGDQDQPAVPEVEVLSAREEDALGVRYRARRLSDNREVEVRLIRPPLAANPAYRRRFLQEGAQLAALPKHGGLIATLRAGEAGDALFRISESVAGETTADVLIRAETLAEETCLDLAAQAVEALIFLAGKRLSHGGVEPGTLVLAQAGQLKLREPGLVPVTAEEAQLPEGALLLSPAYRSPARLRGESGACFSDDVHALGASLHQLVIGDPPFPGATAEEVAARILSDAPPDPRTARPELSYGFAVLVQRMMARDPKQGFADPRALSAFVDQVRRGRVREPKKAPTATALPGPAMALPAPATALPAPAMALPGPAAVLPGPAAVLPAPAAALPAPAMAVEPSVGSPAAGVAQAVEAVPAAGATRSGVVADSGSAAAPDAGAAERPGTGTPSGESGLSVPGPVDPARLAADPPAAEAAERTPMASTVTPMAMDAVTESLGADAGRIHVPSPTRGASARRLSARPARDGASDQVPRESVWVWIMCVFLFLATLVVLSIFADSQW